MIRRQYSSAVKIDGEDLHEYYRFLLREYPDVLEAKKVSEITGYAIPVISRWCRNGKVTYFFIRAMNMIPKIYLIDFARYHKVRELVEGQLHHARVDGVLSMYDLLSEAEKSEFRRRLEKR